MFFQSVNLNFWPEESAQAKAQRQKTESFQSKAKYYLGNLALGIHSSTLGLVLSHWTASRDICLNEIIPSQMKEMIYATGKLTDRIVMPLVSPLPTPLKQITSIAFAVPLFEEIQYRFLCQEFLLRRVPKMILNKLAPQSTHLVDAKLTKLARIALIAGLFALDHLSQVAVEEGDCLESNLSVFNRLGMGLLWGYLAEKTGGIAQSFLFHGIHNFLAAIR